MWLPDHLMAIGILPLRGGGVSDNLTTFVPILTTYRERIIWRYAELGCIEEFFTNGFPLDEILDTLLEHQSDALIVSGMRCLGVEADTV